LPRKHPINSDPPAVISYMKFVTGLLAIAVLAFFTGVEAKTKPQSVNVNATIKVSVNGHNPYCERCLSNSPYFLCACGCILKNPDNKQREQPEAICDPVCDEEHFCVCGCMPETKHWCDNYCKNPDHCKCDCKPGNLCTCKCT